MSDLTPVPYDPELLPGLAMFLDMVERIPLRAHTILANRDHFARVIPPVDVQLAERPDLEWEELTIPGPAGAPDVLVTLVRPRERSATPVPGVLSIHGGGYVLGTRHFGIGDLIDLATNHAAVGISVEYRLAPEHPHPAAAEDCYAALVWLASHADELGIDPARILVTGASAGGGLSAAVSLLARERGGPAIAGQFLGCPMIDDRNDTVSARQYDGIGAWDRNNNDTGWTAALGELRSTDAVTPIQAPARATDLSGLPPAYIDVGAADVFRDESVAYASAIWAAGGQAELHVWAGGYHGFAGFSPDAAVSKAANAARANWLERILR